MRKFFAHPLTQKTRRILRRIVATSAVILAVAVVMTASVDLGPALRARAEREGSNYLKRPMRIRRLIERKALADLDFHRAAFDHREQPPGGCTQQFRGVDIVEQARPR